MGKMELKINICEYGKRYPWQGRLVVTAVESSLYGSESSVQPALDWH
jgi:hypothetical protein